MTQTNTQSRPRWLSVAGGICLLSAILGHFGNDAIRHIVYVYHIPLLFLLLGCSLELSVRDGDRPGRLFGALMGPYFLTGLAVLVMDVVNQMVFEGTLSFVSLTKTAARDLLSIFTASGSNKTLMGLELGHRIGAIWFLPGAFFAWLLAAAVCDRTDSWPRRFLLAGAAAVTGFVTADFFWLPFSLQPALVAVPFVLLGRYVMENGWEKKSSHLPVCLLILAAVGGYGAWIGKPELIRMNFPRAWAPDPVLSMLAAGAAALLVLWLAVRLQRSRSLAWLGRQFIPVLCLHLFALNTLGRWIRRGLGLFLPRLPEAGSLSETLLMTAVHLLLIGGGLWAVQRLCRRKDKTLPEIRSRRDPAVDVFRALLIVLMIIGHNKIDPAFRRTIFSMHMMAFVFLSGWFYKAPPVLPGQTARERAAGTGRRILAIARGLLVPYGLFALGYLLIARDGWEAELKTLIYGISWAKNLFTDIRHLGPIYFVLMLFVVRVVYLLLDELLKTDLQKTAAVLALSLLGTALGLEGYWLPWSFDCALYCLIFYHLGRLSRRIDLLGRLKEKRWLYFVFSPVWVYFIYRGSMEMAVRKYWTYGLTLVGCLCGIFTVYILVCMALPLLPRWLQKLLGLVGQATMYILIVHSLIRPPLQRLLEGQMGLDRLNIPNVLLALLIQLTLGTVLFLGIEGLKKRRKPA